MEALVNRSNRGFTMLETLMAVGVVTLIVGLSYFAQSHARQMREQMRCLNSLRQWSVALALYANEHDGAYPQSPLLYHVSPEMGSFLSGYLHVQDSTTYSDGSLPMAMCRSGAGTATQSADRIGWTVLAGYSNIPACQYDYAGLNMMTERAATDSGKPILACMTATDGESWISHGIDSKQYPTEKPRGQIAAWPDGHARWVKYANLEPAVTEPGNFTSFLPGPNVD
jgi:hypothetical protein